jgi:uncharacterized protein YkwD
MWRVRGGAVLRRRRLGVGVFRSLGVVLVLCRASVRRGRRFTLGIVLCGLALAAMLLTSGVATAATATPRKELKLAINAARAAHGIERVMGSAALRVTALRHSLDMMARGYFAHTSPTGSTITYRIEHSGFVYGYSWRAGETLAWGSGSHATPSATVAAWLRSPPHRAILLSRSFRWVGIGRTCGRFIGHAHACVWTADFVVRQ